MILLDADGEPVPSITAAARVRNPKLDKAPALTLDRPRRSRSTSGGEQSTRARTGSTRAKSASM